MKKASNPWTTISGEEKYDNPWINVTEYQVLNPKGGQGIYGKVHFKNLAIGIIPVDKDMNTWLVGQFRYPLNEYSWEIPEGGGKIGISPLESAKRELLEETGLKANKWTEILTMHLSNSVTDEKAIIFLAEDLSQHEAEPEETEELMIKKVSFEEAYQMVLNGEITDAMSVAGILKAKLLLTC
jgi:8-oxo-dGTP pyrophosphatase MutT (NUDIX family)